MATRLTVTYTGGETETIAIRPVGLVAAERKFGSGVNDGHSMEAMLWAGWVMKGKPSNSFDTWLETIDELELDRGEPVRPLAEEPSPEESPN